MNRIIDFRKIRADGNQVNDSMTVEEIIAKGWKPSKVIEVKWECFGKSYSLRNIDGMSAVLLSDDSSIAVVYPGYPCNVFKILNSDGTERLVISNEKSLEGEVVIGSFCSPHSEDIQGHVCCKVNFQSPQLHYQFDLYIDAVTGVVVHADELRY